MKEYKIDISSLREYTEILRAGDRVELTGVAYTSRDAAHKRYFSLIESGEPLPIDIDGSVIYYAGPTPTPQGMAIGSCGPTTSGRMDPYAPTLLDMGLVAMIGKGDRNDSVYEAIRRNKAVYFCAVGGAGALYSKCIEKCEVVAFEDLGCESVKRLQLRSFPVIVGIDCNGGSLFRK